MEKLALPDFSEHDDKQSTVVTTPTADEIFDDEIRLFKIPKMSNTNDKKQVLGVLRKLPLEVISSIISFATVDEWLNWLRVSSSLYKVSSRTTSLQYYWRLLPTNMDQLATKKVRSLQIGRSVTSSKELEMISRQSQLERLLLLGYSNNFSALYEMLPKSLRLLQISGSQKLSEPKLNLSAFANLTQLAVFNFNIWDYAVLPPSLTAWTMIDNFNGTNNINDIDEMKKMNAINAIKVLSALPLTEFCYIGKIPITERDLLFLSRCMPKLEKLYCTLPDQVPPPPPLVVTVPIIETTLVKDDVICPAALFPQLTSLDTTGTRLESLEKFVSVHAGLQVLYLRDGDEKQSFSFRFLKQLPHLTKLRLYNKYKGKADNLDALTTMTSLTELHMQPHQEANEKDEEEQERLFSALPPSLTSLNRQCFKPSSATIFPQIRQLSLAHSSKRHQDLSLKWFLNRFPELRELELQDNFVDDWCSSWIKTCCSDTAGSSEYSNSSTSESDSRDAIEIADLIASNKIEVIKVQIADLDLTDFRNLVTEILATYPKLRLLQLGGELNRFRTVPDEVFALTTARGINLVY